jgi:hypothetical protein
VMLRKDKKRRACFVLVLSGHEKRIREDGMHGCIEVAM